MTDFNRPDLVLVDRENKTTLVIDIAVFLTHRLSNIEAQKIKIYENLTLKLNNVYVYPLVISAEVVVTRTS